MAAVVADTHAAVWYLTNSSRLSLVAGKALDEASAAGDSIIIPSICLVELTYLVEKGRLPSEARKRLVDALSQPNGPYELAPLDGRVAAAVELIDRNLVPDMPDRIIAATALSSGAALVSRDRKICSSQLQTIW
ncbi:MAG: type II toxin-antitoxin system VapC family toxin [Acidobacteriia bacterium]|nr:type II toxin-antitoxin system VapC family toxin [Terriglobia bacterium]